MQKSLNYGYYIIFTVSEVRRRGHDPALQLIINCTLNYNLNMVSEKSEMESGFYLAIMENLPYNFHKGTAWLCCKNRRYHDALLCSHSLLFWKNGFL